MFCDLVGSTPLARTLDPEELRNVICNFQDACVVAVEQYDGYISRYAGDGVLVLFGYPSAHEDDALRAALAGIYLIEAIASLKLSTSAGSVKLSVRIGIATGLVVAGDLIGEQTSQERAIVGETPALAARLQSLAQPNRILVSFPTYRLIRNTLCCRSIGPQTLKGYPDPVQVFEVVPPELATQTPIGIAEQQSTPLVGRDSDVAVLKEFLSPVKGGAGRAILVRGEPGIGKSRLVTEISGAFEASQYYTLNCRCSPYFTNSPLHPVIDLLRSLLRLSTSETHETVLAKLKAEVGPHVQLSHGLSDLVSLLIMPQDPLKEQMRPSVLQRTRPLEAITELMLRLAEDKSLLLIVEDLHWVDPSTLQLLGILIDKAPETQMLIILTARPEFSSSMLNPNHTTVHTVERLKPQDAERIVATLAGDTPLCENLRQLIVARADGVPLFIEELTRTVVESESFRDAETTNSKVESAAIPTTLRDSLMARLDRLGNAKPIAQLAAVVGRTFPYQLLRAVAELGETELNNRLSGLVKAELLHRRGRPSESVYYFRHSLIQEAAYESLLNSKRRVYHEQIAHVIEEQFPEISGTQPELIAQHYTKARVGQKAAQYWMRAGELALKRSAGIEAVNHAREGLKIIKEIESGRARDKMELSLLVTLGTSLSATQGYAIPEVDQAYGRALKLCNRLNETSDLFSVLRGLHSFYLLRGPLTVAKQLGGRLVEITKDQEDPITLSEATRCLGWTLFCNGKMHEGREHVQRAISLYDRARSQEYTRQNVSDAGGVGLVNLGWINWFLGYTDAAVARSQEAIELAREIEHPFTLAYALCMGAAVYQCRREPDNTQALAEEAIAIASEQRFRYWMAWGTSLQGWAIAKQNEKAEGVRKIGEGLSWYRETGAALFVPYILSLLAEVQAGMGDEDGATELLHEAMEVEKDRRIYFFSAETNRLLAELMWALGDRKAAMVGFKRALATARRQGARSLELRAATSLTRIANSEGRKAQAQEQLSVIAGGIGEGHDTADYCEAMRLI